MKIKVTKELGVTLAHLGVFTHWSYEEALQGKSWLTSFDFLDIADDIVIETPSAFYASNPPTAKFLCKGGLCTIGSYSYTHSFLPSDVIIGRYTSIASGLKILEFSHPIEWLSTSVAFFTPKPLVSKSALAEFIDTDIARENSLFYRSDFDPTQGRKYPVIGHDVWIGENVTLAMGITIGNGAIIASNTTVTKDVPPYAVVAGCPGTIKKYRFDKDLIDKITESEWWDYDVISFAGLDYKDPISFINDFNLN
ncbi:TPA: CatB-related O-acetyltransferase, partial [Escherichia coli]